MKKFVILILSIAFIQLAAQHQAYGQTGITTSPSRLFYTSDAGGSGSQKIVIQNPSDKELEVGVSFSDWCYDSLGNNVIKEAGTLPFSCASWITIAQGSYFVLKPYERKELDVIVTAPKKLDTFPTHTAMLFATQLNPGAANQKEDGASIKVTVRMGVKIYHSTTAATTRNIEIADFRHLKAKEKEGDMLELKINSLSNTWVKGKVKVELLNTSNGKKTNLSQVDFYQLPGDHRLVRIAIPEKADKGKYNATAVVSYGERDELKVAELDFELN